MLHLLNHGKVAQLTGKKKKKGNHGAHGCI